MHKMTAWLALSAFSIYILAYVMPDGPTGILPTLGWNSWNAYNCDITEEKILTAMKALIDSGLRDAGYTYINIDDCWSMKEGRVHGHIAPNTTRFPNGIKDLADTIHSKALSFGIYSAAGTQTCAGCPGSLGYEDVDAEDFAAWGVDYLKYDNCWVPAEWEDPYTYCETGDPRIKMTANGTCKPENNPDLAPADYDWRKSSTFIRYRQMRDALARQPREILFSLSLRGFADVYSWGNETGVNWCIGGDIEPNWGSIMRITNSSSFHLHSVDFWGGNDADMLEVGNGQLTDAETRSHFALWAMMKSPLSISTDVTKLSNANIGILKNPLLLAFNQDKSHGVPAMPYKWGTNPDWTYNTTWPAEYWSGRSKAEIMVLVSNPGDSPRNMTVDWSEVPGLEMGKSYKATAIWTGKTHETCIRNGVGLLVGPHDCDGLLLSDC